MGLINEFSKRVVLNAVEDWSDGKLRMELPDGEVLEFGRSDGSAPALLRVHDDRAFSRVLFGGTIGAGEAYMAGDWSSDDLPRLLAGFMRNGRQVRLNSPFSWPCRQLQLWRHRHRANTRHGSRRNIQDHYDLSNEFYQTFLDETMAYSCALFQEKGQPIEGAQRRKYQSICQKLDLQPSDHLLEIGTGWGGFAIYAASRFGCPITTITISQRQFSLARQRVADAGLSHLVDVQYRDYRDLEGRFDKIVSIEMFEAVGREYWESYFRQCDRLLAPGGTMVLQTITWPDSLTGNRTRGGSWLHKYIFPGSLIPTVPEIKEVVARCTSRQVRQVEEIGMHYVDTLSAWRERFWKSIDRVLSLGFNDRFVRMWDFYLATCQSSFATRWNGDVQMVLS